MSRKKNRKVASLKASVFFKTKKKKGELNGRQTKTRKHKRFVALFYYKYLCMYQSLRTEELLYTTCAASKCSFQSQASALFFQRVLEPKLQIRSGQLNKFKKCNQNQPGKTKSNTMHWSISLISSCNMLHDWSFSLVRATGASFSN